MSYSSAEIISILGSVGTLVGIIVTGMITVMNANRNSKVIVTEQQIVKEKIAEVHDQTNSHLSKLETKLQISQDALTSSVLEIQIAENTRVKLADEAAAVLRQAPPVQPPQVVVVTKNGGTLG